MPTVELERSLVKSAPELWEELVSKASLTRCLGEVRVFATDPPNRLEWDGRGASGVIELESSGWGTKVRALATTSTGSAWLRWRATAPEDFEKRLTELLDELGSSSLKSG